MSLWLCVLGVIGVDTILCYYILQQQFCHPHPDGFYPMCSGLEGSSWGRDAASQTTSAQRNCVFSRAKEKSRFIQSKADSAERLWHMLCHKPSRVSAEMSEVTSFPPCWRLGQNRSAGLQAEERMFFCCDKTSSKTTSRQRNWSNHLTQI